MSPNTVESPWRSLQIDARSGVPIWVQLRTQLEYVIATGAVPGGTQLPSVRQLSGQLGVAVDTVRQAYDELVRMSLAESIRGRGTFSCLPGASNDGEDDRQVRAEVDAAVAAVLTAGGNGDTRRIEALAHRVRMLDVGLRVGFVGVGAAAERYAGLIGAGLPNGVTAEPIALDSLRDGATEPLAHFSHLVALMFHVAEVRKAAPLGTNTLALLSRLKPEVLDRISALDRGPVGLVARADTAPIYRDLVIGRRSDLDLVEVTDDRIDELAQRDSLVAVLHTTVTGPAIRRVQPDVPLIELAHGPQAESLDAVSSVLRQDLASLLEFRRLATTRPPITT